MDYYAVFQKFIRSKMDILYEMDGMKSKVSIPSTTDNDTVALFNISVYIPAITFILLCNQFNQRQDVESPLDKRIRWFVCIISSISAYAFYCRSTQSHDPILYSNLYLCSAAHVSLLIMHLSFGYRRPDVGWGIMIAHFGTIFGFIILAVMYFFGEWEMFYAMYRTGLCIFLFGFILSVHILVYTETGYM